MLNFISYVVCREKDTKPVWFSTVPDHAKLTDSDIDVFVNCLLPAVRMAMFSKAGTLDAAITLHNLALLRPEVVLPDLLNRYLTRLQVVCVNHIIISLI